MASFNKVILVGNLTRDPELSWTPGKEDSASVAVTKMGLAVSEKYKSKAGKQVESVCFVDVVVWRRQAETCAEYLSKGSPVLIEGRLQFDQWENKQGEKRNKLRVRADRVQFLGSPKRAEFQDSQAGNAEGEKQEAPPQDQATENHSGDEDNMPF
ncbi:single-stranded DNA-binding protein [Verrucomicrobiota bacterium]